ncbi:hypothetical protein D3H66_05800 [Citrobacter portucalensis]|uniref:Uncharacterized protein n=1 Tax=Citrobacter portucalensis TaxID=1639133 RepID=A0A5B0T5Y8_9ENTR|nr:hypothetical protein D3H66_05800 [Citrobacter portucalensis]
MGAGCRSHRGITPHVARRIVKLKIHHTFYENSVTASIHYLIKMFQMKVIQGRVCASSSLARRKSETE